MTDAVSEVEGWDRQTLIERWRSAFGHEPPRHVRTEFMRLALGWQVQAGLQPGRRAKTLAKPAPVKKRGLTPGTRLIREWKGTTYQVAVTDCGFEFDGRPYTSLTAIATEITGTAWSGPRFFGTKR